MSVSKRPRVSDAWKRSIVFTALAFSAVCSISISTAIAQVCALPGSAGDATISGTVNTYWTPGAGSYNNGSTTIALSGQRGAVATLAEGDLVLVIQMQCANINSSDSPSYGDGAAGEPASGYSDPAGGCLAGRYQFLRAGTGSSNAILNLAGSPLIASYEQANATATTGRRTFQVIRVPQYANLTIGGTVAAAEWDGNNGGVVVLDAAFTLNLGAGINVDGAGFRGGAGRARAVADAIERFRWDDDTRHGVKGEGIAGTPRFVSLKRDPDSGATAGIVDLGLGWGGYPTGTASTGDFARGAPGNAGGGGTFWDGASDNGGGGGGGNGRPGGRGGAGWRSVGYAGVLADYSNLIDKKWGFGGDAFSAVSVSRLVMGGGGGAGDNNANSQAAESSGAAGGGIVMIRATTLTGGGAINARGARAADNPTNDGGGGGGAGGSVLIVATTWSASPSIDVSGGRGGDAWPTGGSAHGPGGGGSGGVVITSSPVAPTLNGGASGVTNIAQAQPGGANHGAELGGNGVAQTIAPAADTPGSDVGRTCKADIRITKTNTPGVNGEVDQAADTVDSDATTVYTITVTNDGPKPADSALVVDPPPTGLICTTATCIATGGAVCPVQTGAALVTALQGAGVIVPTFPLGASVNFLLSCTVQ
jgi:uncharacterized repeat protein (TIGR01451 family)